jgi:hypothetical protein
LWKILPLLTPQICVVSDNSPDAATDSAAADVTQTAASFQPSWPIFNPAPLENEVVGDSPLSRNSFLRPSRASVEQSDLPGHCRFPV